MKRNEFIKLCGLLGIGIPFAPSLMGCNASSDVPSNFDGSVLIIGSGAAGLTAGHLLAQRGIDFQILEASSTYGGRMKRTNDFVDFPIPLGAEWLHVGREVLDEIINDPAVPAGVVTTPYDSQQYALYNGMEVSMEDIGFTIDQKFIASSWFDFYERYVVPSVQDRIQYNQVVSAIDYAGDVVSVQTNSGTFTADKVIVTVPVKILQQGSISFNPILPQDKLVALNEITVWDGFKAFIEFSEKFYPAAVAFDIVPESAGQKLYYDASYGQDSQRHVLGLFSVGTGTLPYRNLNDSDLISFMLEELDGIFDGMASKTYLQHTSQNWNEEPHIQGAYITDSENWRYVRTLGEAVGNNLFFAGTSYTDGEDWSSVHTAARSAIRAVNSI